jgi:hypothetical protein
MIAAISLALSALAILISLGALFYAWRQTHLMQQQEEERQRENQAVKEWTEKFYRAAALAAKIRSMWLSFVPGGAPTNVYGHVFRDPELQGRIAFHLISIDSSHSTAQVRPVTPEQLSVPAMRKTITDVLDRVEQFKRDNPANAKQFDI